MSSARPAGLPEIVAHRGDAEHFPENTLPAIEAALRLGLRHVEFDVQVSADGVPYVIHDATLDRTTTATGDLRLLRSNQLDGVDACEPARFGERHAGTRLPRLSAVAGLLAGEPRALAFVEIKRASLAHHGHEPCIARILDELAPVREQCVLISFDARACALARERSGLPVGWVFEGRPESHLTVLRELAPEYAFCDQEPLPPGAALPAGDWTWAVYEVTDAEQALDLHRRGAALVESMVPSRLLAGLDRGLAGTPA